MEKTKLWYNQAKMKRFFTIKCFELKKGNQNNLSISWEVSVLKLGFKSLN
jgi:hypothetical protein